MAIFSQQNNSKSRLFVEKKLSSLRFAIALLLALGLLVCERHEHGFIKLVRGSFSTMAAPLQFAIDYPVRIIGWVGSVLGSKQSLIVENMNLRSQTNKPSAKSKAIANLNEESFFSTNSLLLLLFC